MSTIYSTTLSRTFWNRAVRTQMCLMACAERGWGARPADDPCLLRGSCAVLCVLLNKYTERERERERERSEKEKRGEKRGVRRRREERR